MLSFPANRDRVRALVTGPPDSSVTYAVTSRRWEGLLDAWREAGGAPGDLRIAVCQANAAGLGEAFADELFGAGDPPDAIAAMSDELALGALRAAFRTGRAVPDAVAITGWDDSDAAGPAGLTTLRQSLRDQGERCARIALGRSRAAGQDPPHWQVVPRASTRSASPGPPAA